MAYNNTQFYGTLKTNSGSVLFEYTGGEIVVTEELLAKSNSNFINISLSNSDLYTVIYINTISAQFWTAGSIIAIKNHNFNNNPNQRYPPPINQGIIILNRKAGIGNIVLKNYEANETQPASRDLIVLFFDGTFWREIDLAVQ